MPEIKPLEMCANCCYSMDRCRCRIVSVPVSLKAAIDRNEED